MDTDTRTVVLGDDPDRLFTPDELRKLLGGISDRTLRGWAAAGSGPKRLRLGKHLRYRAGDVRSWLDTKYETS